MESLESVWPRSKNQIDYSGISFGLLSGHGAPDGFYPLRMSNISPCTGLVVNPVHQEWYEITYQCNWEPGVRKRVVLDQKGQNDSQILLRAYKSWFRLGRIDDSWTQWINATLNNSSNDPLSPRSGEAFSIDIILDWSAFRMSVVILLSILLSLAIGFGWIHKTGMTLQLFRQQGKWLHILRLLEHVRFLKIGSGYTLSSTLVMAALLTIVSRISDNWPDSTQYSPGVVSCLICSVFWTMTKLMMCSTRLRFPRSVDGSSVWSWHSWGWRDITLTLLFKGS